MTHKKTISKFTLGLTGFAAVISICINAQKMKNDIRAVYADNKAVAMTTTAPASTEPSTQTTTFYTTETTSKTTIVATAATTTTTTEPDTTEPDTTEIPVTESVVDTDCFTAINYMPTEEEMTMFCLVVSSETGYCEDDAQKAVAHTIINRVLSDKFPNNIADVVTQEGQYDTIHRYFDGQYRPGLEPDSDGWNKTMQLCYDAMSEYDFTNGAVVYYNPDIIGYQEWFENLTLVYTDQYGRFFKI